MNCKNELEMAYFAHLHLHEQIEESALDYLRDSARQIMGKDTMGHFVRLLERTREYHEEFAVVGSEHGDPHFAQKVSTCLFEETCEQIFRCLPVLPDEQKQFVCRFLEGGGSSILEYWIQTGMEQDPPVLAQMILDLSNAAMGLHNGRSALRPIETCF